MFQDCEAPRLFGVPPGLDFPKALVNGLRTRLSKYPPEHIAKVELFVNTRRMQRRLVELFSQGPGTLLPRIRLVTDLAQDMQFAEIPPAVPALRRRLELTQLVGKLLEKEPKLAPRAALYDLADSLANLLEEMQSENVAPSVLHDLDVSDVSGHWQRSLEFVNLIEPFFGSDVPGIESRQRCVIESLSRKWATDPPKHPIIIAGSTGSRGATSLFMQSVLKLPQGAVVLPGVDFDMPSAAWKTLTDTVAAEDHPQYRFARIAKSVGVLPSHIEPWTGERNALQSRNRLISLALRPAPVTDQWLVEGPKLSGLDTATADMTLIEAPSPRAEAMAIALALRQAAEDGATAALISPDRVLTRQVTAALDRWRITPDDSAGRPLPLSAPGRLLRHVAGMIGRNVTSDALLAILKHPLVATGGQARGPHLLNTRELELWLRRQGPAYVRKTEILKWVAKGVDTRTVWGAWLIDILHLMARQGEQPLGDCIVHHIKITELLAAGPEVSGSGILWEEAAGVEAARVVDSLKAEAESGGSLNPDEYAALFHGVLQTGDVREAITSHPGIMIWGTLEARVQGADLVILAGLNEGTWPEPPRPDPWLNRVLRSRAGLLLPDREIGLSAHDFQQAVCAPRVILSRAVRNAEAQTVPSRWVNRLTHLLGGLGDAGDEALTQMRARGDTWLDIAGMLDTPEIETESAKRPSPQPPVEVRPTEISITEVKNLIRDPYAIYAKRVLRLRPLDPIRKTPDAPLRGTIMHMIVERFVSTPPTGVLDEDCARLLEIADPILAEHAGWPAARRLWRARIEKLANWFVQTDYQRQNLRTPAVLEAKGTLNFPNLDTVLKGTIDRVDRDDIGNLAIYDYKTGQIPTAKQQEFFDKQLLLAAAIAEHGKIEGTAPAKVTEVGYIGMGATPKFEPTALDSDEVGAVLAEFQKLISAYRQRERGYTSRRAVEQTSYGQDYDHLARYGEWDESDPPSEREVG